MLRQSRIEAPGALRHVICRGIERRKFAETVQTGMILPQDWAKSSLKRLRRVMLGR